MFSLLNNLNYSEFINKLKNKNPDNNTIFIETYANLDLLLREVLDASELSFTTARSRFLYIVENKKLSEIFKKTGSIVFNLHYKIFDKKYNIEKIEKDSSLYIFQELYNLFSNEKISLLKPDEIDLINSFIKEKFSVKEVLRDRFDCHLKEIKETQTKFNHPLFELIVTDDFGDEVSIFLWLENSLEKIPIHKRFDYLKVFFKPDRMIRFFNLSWSQKGYYFQNEETTLVIEPNFLLDITAVAECFQAKSIIPELFFLKFIQQAEFNLAILKGGFINYLLDAVITKKDIDLQKDFKSLLKSQFLKILSYSKNDFTDILLDINQNHLQNLMQTAKFYKGEKISLEPSFISKEYGLQGRLDALIEYHDDENNKTVFELKSGNPPAKSLWQNHYAQVMGYNLLLKSVYGKQRTGYSMLLYSKAGKEPLRNVTYSESAISQILMCRNIIVNEILKLSNQETDLYTILSSLKQASLPKYLYSNLQDFFNLYKQLETYEIKYINTMIAFVLKEMIAQKIGYIDDAGTVRHGYSSLWTLNLSEKIKQKTIIQNLVLESSEGQIFYFSFFGNRDLGGFREGDLLLLYPVLKDKDDYSINPLKVPIFKAVLKKVSERTIGVQFRNELINIENLNSYDYFFAERDILESSFYSIPGSIINFFNSEKMKRKIFFGLSKPRFYEKINKDLSSTFDRVLEKADKFRDYLLIQGPPGTGKTSRYLISIIKQHIDKKKSPVVILAFTNRAVEEICHKLLDNELNFILLGTKSTEKDYHISSLAEFESNKSFDKDLISIKKKLSKTLIFVSTVANFQNEGVFLKKYVHADLLIVDEASQLLETQLFGIISYFSRFILIGDHFQLPAVSTQDISDIPKELCDLTGIKSLKDSLFERLHRRCLEKKWHDAYDLLPEHYRMHKSIADLINPFYSNKLRPSNKRQFLEFNFYGEVNNSLLQKLSQSRTVFLPTSEKEHIRYNIEESEKIYIIVKTIYEHMQEAFTENTIGVICAWKLQVNLISEKLLSLPCFSKTTVDTVERFQGSERDIIIYSTALSNQDLLKNMQSLTIDNLVDRKLNVAISRAKEQFILMGNPEILSYSQHYKRVIDSLSRIETIF